MSSVKTRTPPSPNVLERRRSSEANHIERIRSATAKKFTIPWIHYDSQNEDAGKKLKIFKGKIINPDLIKSSKFPQESKITGFSISESDLDQFHKSAGKKMKKEIIMSAENKISLDGVKQGGNELKESQKFQDSKEEEKYFVPDDTGSDTQENIVEGNMGERNVTSPGVEIRNKSKAARTKDKSTQKNKTHRSKKSVGGTRKKLVTSKSRVVKSNDSNIVLKSKAGTKTISHQRRKLSVSPHKHRRNILKSTKRTLSKKNTKKISSSQNRMKSSGINIAENLMSPRTLQMKKDVIVLKWLHNLQCPQSDKNISNNEKSKSFPIRIMKRPLRESKYDSKTRNMGRKRSSSHSRRSMDVKTNKRVSSQTRSRTKRKSIDLENDDSSHKKERKSEAENDAVNSKSVKIKKDLKDNVIKLSTSRDDELIITMNLKSLSADDAAIIIWLDDLRSLASEIKKYGNTTHTLVEDEECDDVDKSTRKYKSLPGIYDLRRRRTLSKDLLKVPPLIPIEDISTPRPSIYFPSVTILKNLAVDSKQGVKDVDENLSNSVYYKRCNLNHLDWVDPELLLKGN